MPSIISPEASGPGELPRGGRLREVQGVGRGDIPTRRAAAEGAARGARRNPPAEGERGGIRASALKRQASGPGEPPAEGGRGGHKAYGASRRAHGGHASEMGGVAPHRASSIYIYM